MFKRSNILNPNDFIIPPCPQVITDLSRERSRPEPDFRKIAMLIESDIGISAGVLKSANSPLFGVSRKISDIGQAIVLMGITRTIGVAMALKMSLIGKQHPLTSQIWEHSRSVAEIAAGIAKVLKIADIQPNIAHTTGLLHDCGFFPMLQSKDFDQSKSVKEICSLDMNPANASLHAHWGYYMLKSWGLPELVCQAVKFHHDFNNIEESNIDLKNLVALLVLSEHVSWIINDPLNETRLKSSESHLSVLEHLHLSMEDFCEIKNDIWEAQC